MHRPADALVRVPSCRIGGYCSGALMLGPLAHELTSTIINQPVLVTDLHMLHRLPDATVVRAWGAESQSNIRNERAKFRKALLRGLPFPTMLFRMPRGVHGSREPSQWFVWRVDHKLQARKWPHPLPTPFLEAEFWTEHHKIEDTIMEGVKTSVARALLSRLLLKLRAAGARPMVVEAVLKDPEFEAGLRGQ